MKLLASIVLALTVCCLADNADASQKHSKHTLQCTTQYVLGGTVTTCK